MTSGPMMRRLVLGPVALVNELSCCLNQSCCLNRGLLSRTQFYGIRGFLHSLYLSRGGGRLSAGWVLYLLGMSLWLICALLFSL